jgi:hypothetical protein
MELEVGKKYRARNGSEVLVLNNLGCIPGLPFKGCNGLYYTYDGRAAERQSSLISLIEDDMSNFKYEYKEERPIEGVEYHSGINDELTARTDYSLGRIGVIIEAGESGAFLFKKDIPEFIEALRRLTGEN